MHRRRIAVLGVLTVATLGYLLWFTPFVGVGTVEVTGVRTLTVDEVRSAADIPSEYPMVRVDTGEVAARVATLTGVADVEVARSWPSTLTITVTERRAIAYHQVGDDLRLVDADGVRFQRMEGSEPPEGLPRLELLDPGPADDKTRAATAVLASLPAELSDQLVVVRASTPGSVEFELADGRLVRWGDAEQNSYKARVLAVLLTREGTAFDVSSPELPTVS